jgi:hypothetical protein
MLFHHQDANWPAMLDPALLLVAYGERMNKPYLPSAAHIHGPMAKAYAMLECWEDIGGKPAEEAVPDDVFAWLSLDQEHAREEFMAMVTTGQGVRAARTGLWDQYFLSGRAGRIREFGEGINTLGILDQFRECRVGLGFLEKWLREFGTITSAMLQQLVTWEIPEQSSDSQSERVSQLQDRWSFWVDNAMPDRLADFHQWAGATRTSVGRRIKFVIKAESFFGDFGFLVHTCGYIVDINMSGFFGDTLTNDASFASMMEKEVTMLGFNRA